MRRLLPIVVAAVLAGCGDPGQSTTAPVTRPAAAARPTVGAATKSAPPTISTRPGAEPRATVATPAVPLPAADAVPVLADCLWYADPTPPTTEGAGSMAELDARIRSELGREARVVGRARLTARGCPRVSVGVAVVRDARDVAEGDSEPPPFAITGDDSERAPIAGARGDERRDGPWQRPAGPLEAIGDCNADAPPDVYLFRALHGATGAVEAMALVSLGVDACFFYGHDLQHGDLDRDLTTEIRVEVRIGSPVETTAGAERAHRLWIYDLASMRPELALRLGGEDRADSVGIMEDRTTGSIALRDVDGDGDRDVVVRRFSAGVEGNGEHAYRDWSTQVHAYDAPTDAFLRAPELDARAANRD